MGCYSRGDNRDTTLSFLLHPIGYGSPVINRTKTMRPTGIEQDPFGRRRLSGIDMGDDANISVAF
jgi:hypothetical protein